MNIRPYRDKAWLYGHYVISGKSAETLADMVNCSPRTVEKWLKRFGITLRKKRIAAELGLSYEAIWEHELNEFDPINLVNCVVS